MAQFKNSEHEERYYTVLSKMKSTDSYHRAVAYLFTLDKDFQRGRNKARRSELRLADKHLNKNHTPCVQPLEHLY